MKSLSTKEIVFIGFTLFSMLFGAGNLIFPAYMGFAAGDHTWQADVGFIFSDVGLAILGFIAIAKAGSFDKLTNRVHPLFALFLPMAIYLSIGPGLAVPRAGSLAFQMGVQPFLPSSISTSPIALLLYTIVFFSLVFWFAKSPSKLVERLGKILTPTLLVLIIIVGIRALFVGPVTLDQPIAPYQGNSLGQGFLDGYMTMDALGTLIYGIVFVNIFKDRGITSPKLQEKYLIKSGVVMGILCTVCYIIVSYLGVIANVPDAENGADVLSAAMAQLFGTSGTIVLGLIFTVACLCVCVGLLASCATFFASKFTKLSYGKWLIIMCIASGAVANAGLTQILKVSVPILGLIYPIAITLVILGLIGEKLPYKKYPIYPVTIGVVSIYSLVEVLNTAVFNGYFTTILSHVPFQTSGFGWILPVVIGFVCSYLYYKKDINDVRNKIGA